MVQDIFKYFQPTLKEAQPYTAPFFSKAGLRKYLFVLRSYFICHLSVAHISLPIGTNGKPLAAIGKFSSAIGKFMIGKTLATNGEEITNVVIGNDVLANYW